MTQATKTLQEQISEALNKPEAERTPDEKRLLQAFTNAQQRALDDLRR